MTIVPPFDFDNDEFNAPGPPEWAAMYRSISWQVVPAVSHTEVPKDAQWKRPKLTTWTEYQKTLMSQAEFDRFYGPAGLHAQRTNMGVFTGECSGGVSGKKLLMLDLDTYKGPAAMAWWLETLEIENNRIEPETVRQVSGGGGQQLFFLVPADWPCRNATTRLNVDIRCDSGFAMLPPSLHDSGRRYEWADGLEPWNVSVTVAEPWLLDAIESLVEAHGHEPDGNGADKTRAERTASPETDFTPFGSRQDGRETEMFRTVWHHILEWVREGDPARPVPFPPEWEPRARGAYNVYFAKVVSRHPGDKEAGLAKDGRGWKAWWGKWRATMRHWGSARMVAEAGKPRPKDDQPKASQPPPAADPSKPVDPIPLLGAFPIDESKLPVRDWIVPGLLLKRNLSVLVAPPGSGKSLLSLQLAIAAAVAMPWAGWTPRKAEKVLIINAEDDLDEMQRRLCAAARSMGVDQERLAGQIFLAQAPECVVIAQFDNLTKSVIRTPLAEKLIATILLHDIGVVVADPFAETFEGDENSNSEVKWAGILWREVARKTATGLLLVHHTRKGAGGMAGDADASRGGGALIGTARILVTLFGMTVEEAEALNVQLDKRTDYVRFDDAKANYSKLEGARWFKKETVRLSNATAFREGDDVGVLVPWVPPGALTGVSTHTINLALEEVDRGPLDESGAPTGQRYTHATTTGSKDRWAGKVFMRLFGCSEATAKGLIKTWLEKDVLRIVTYLDPVQRKSLKGLCAPQQNRPGTTEKFD